MPRVEPTEEELFERLLALDHSRREPWGPLHGVVVACHRLQEADAPVQADDQLVEQLRVYLDGGLPAVGYAERVHAWAEATLAAWCATGN